jgi:hypothetical protein
MQRSFCPAGQQVVEWLAVHQHSQVWLAEQMGIGRAQLWRYLVGDVAIHVDYAASIERITKIPASMWATDASLRPVHADGITASAALSKVDPAEEEAVFSAEISPGDGPPTNEAS